MIEFLSLYLGLVTGLQPVEVVVPSEVASVEILLDGEQVGTLSSPPWRRKVDFGERLVPRRLVAVAYDGEHEELGRAEQILNLPRPTAEVGIVLERDGDGKVVAARLAWQSISSARPRETLVTFDGVPLAVEDPARVPIPDHDPRAFHVLAVELGFSERERAQAVASFGGPHVDEVSTELTALPVVPAKRRLLPAAEIAGAVVHQGRPLPVVSIDKGRADVLFVRDIAAGTVIEQIGARDATGVGGFGVSSATGITSGPSGVTGVAATPGEQLRRMLTLDSDYRIRLMWPATKRVERGEVRMDLFPASPPVTADEGGVYWALTQEIALSGTSDVQRLTDAVAVAGLEAAAQNWRRAVVLVLAADPEDESQYDPANVREYLRVLGVPFRVWAVGNDRKTLSFPEWGEVEVITSLRDLRRAVRRLRDDLEKQRIVWVDGRHLPQELELAPGAEVVRAGS